MLRIAERRAVLLLLALSLGAVLPAAADGMLDPGFGNGGIVITQFPGTGGGFPSLAFSLVVQPDGRAVAAGSVALSISGSAMAVARYVSSGALDTTFSVDGMAQVAFPFFNSYAAADAVLLQPDGRLVLVGGVDSFQFGQFFALARLNLDGSPDPSFGTGGQLTTSFTDPASAVAAILQPDGRIIAVGNAGTAIAAARYNADGSLDPAFGAGGKLTLPLAQPFGVGEAVLQPDGKLVIAGGYGPAASLDFGVVRLLPNGAVDPSFDGDGLVTSDFGAVESAHSVILLGDGRMVLAGYRTTAVTDLALARYFPDGSLDATFGTGGLATADSGASEVPRQVIELPNGKLLVAGWTQDTGAQDFLLARFQAAGALDTSFGTGGFLRTNIGSLGDDQCHGVAMPGPGLVLTAGFTGGSVQPDFALARYIATTPAELLAFEVE